MPPTISGCSEPYTTWPWTFSRGVASTTSQGNLTQCLTTLYVKNFRKFKTIFLVPSLYTCVNSHSPSIFCKPTFSTGRPQWGLSGAFSSPVQTLSVCPQKRGSTERGEWQVAKSPVNTWFSICHTFQEDQLRRSLTGSIAKAELQQEVPAVFTSPCREKHKLKEESNCSKVTPPGNTYLYFRPLGLLELFSLREAFVPKHSDTMRLEWYQVITW